MFTKELSVAALMGVTMAAAVSVMGVVRGGFDVAVVVALTMIVIVIVGSLIGMSLPFVFDKLKLDPATASGPLITSIADKIGRASCREREYGSEVDGGGQDTRKS